MVMRSTSGSRSCGDPRQDARFDELYRRYYRSVRDYCRRRVGSDLVDDAVAETFLTAWRRLADVPDGERALVWLYGVAYRVIGHQWRSTARRRRLEVRLRSIVVDPACVSDESVLDGDVYGRVIEALARLGERDAEVLLLATWEHLGVVEIAAVLGIADNAAAQRLYRARRHFADQYRRLAARPVATGLKGGAS
jgi:RNA polymerase sigma-70 factor (ECF subfamily)